MSIFDSSSRLFCRCTAFVDIVIMCILKHVAMALQKFLTRRTQVTSQYVPGFYQLILSTTMCVCMSLPPRLLTTSGMIWTRLVKP